MSDLHALRHRYAEEIRQKAQVRSPALVRAFAQVPRERYLGPGPWQLFESTGYRTTADADPRHLYHDVAVAFDPARWLNNGLPSFVAFLIGWYGLPLRKSG
jgi:protein-L-isoaspartate(D-aspartate) O-methyltransferase